MKSLIKNKGIKSSISWIVLCFLTIFYICPNAYTQELTDKELLDMRNEIFALYSTNNKDAALEIIKEIPKSKKTDEIYIIEANILEDIDKKSRAIENLNKAIETNPKSYKAYYNIGCILLDKKAYELAIINFKNSIKYNKNFPWGHYNLACCYIEQGEYKKAKKHLIKAITLDGTEKDFYINLALCYKKLDNTKAAEKILNALPKN